MIAITKPVHQDVKVQQDERFLDMLPRIRSQARRAFRQLRPEHKDELVQEVVVICGAWLRPARAEQPGTRGTRHPTFRSAEPP